MQEQQGVGQIEADKIEELRTLILAASPQDQIGLISSLLRMIEEQEDKQNQSQMQDSALDKNKDPIAAFRDELRWRLISIKSQKLEKDLSGPIDLQGQDYDSVQRMINIVEKYHETKVCISEIEPLMKSNHPLEGGLEGGIWDLCDALEDSRKALKELGKSITGKALAPGNYIDCDYRIVANRLDEGLLPDFKEICGGEEAYGHLIDKSQLLDLVQQNVEPEEFDSDVKQKWDNIISSKLTEKNNARFLYQSIVMTKAIMEALVTISDGYGTADYSQEVYYSRQFEDALEQVKNSINAQFSTNTPEDRGQFLKDVISGKKVVDGFDLTGIPVENLKIFGRGICGLNDWEVEKLLDKAAANKAEQIAQKKNDDEASRKRQEDALKEQTRKDTKPLTKQKSLIKKKLLELVGYCNEQDGINDEIQKLYEAQLTTNRKLHIQIKGAEDLVSAEIRQDIGRGVGDLSTQKSLITRIQDIKKDLAETIITDEGLAHKRSILAQGELSKNQDLIKLVERSLDNSIDEVRFREIQQLLDKGIAAGKAEVKALKTKLDTLKIKNGYANKFEEWNGQYKRYQKLQLKEEELRLKKEEQQKIRGMESLWHHSSQNEGAGKRESLANIMTDFVEWGSEQKNQGEESSKVPQIEPWSFQNRKEPPYQVGQIPGNIGGKSDPLSQKVLETVQIKDSGGTEALMKNIVKSENGEGQSVVVVKNPVALQKEGVDGEGKSASNSGGGGRRRKTRVDEDYSGLIKLLETLLIARQGLLDALVALAMKRKSLNEVESGAEVTKDKKMLRENSYKIKKRAIKKCAIKGGHSF